MKIVKRILLGFICVPFLAVLIFIAIELIGLGVNHYATNQQTNTLKETIISAVSDAEILDVYSETGNTSGTGNHVDMLSIALIKTNVELSELENTLNGRYQLDDRSFWIEETSSVKSQHDARGYLSFYEELSVPEDMQNTYIVYLCQSAPFVDNIEGH